MDSPPRPSPPPSCDATTSRAAASERACVAAEWARWLPRVLDSQCQDATHRDHGGFAQHHLPGWCDGRHAAYILARLMAVRLWHAEVARASRPLPESGTGFQPVSVAPPRGTGFQPVDVASPLRRGAGVSPAVVASPLPSRSGVARTAALRAVHGLEARATFRSGRDARATSEHGQKEKSKLTPSAIDAACVAALAFLRRRQAPDGCLDLCGAYSANEVGFPITGLAAAWKRYRDAGLSPTPTFLDELADFMQKGAEAVLAGSVHTANHRWTAACAPLSVVYSLFPDTRYLAKIKDYLADGIDVNADGCWYHERSPNYNGVATMGILALLDNLPELAETLLPPLRRHAEFLVNSLQPNNEADSTLSHRQDRFSPGRPASTYGAVRRLALLTGDGRLSTLAGILWRQNPSPDAEMVPLLLQLDAHPAPLPPPAPLPDTTTIHWKETGQVRIRRRPTLLSLASDAGGHFYDTVRDQWGGPRRSDDWFHLHHAGVVVESLHLAGAGMRNAQPAILRKLATGHYELAADQRGWEHTLHFRPGSPRIPVTWDWKTDITLREQNATAATTTTAAAAANVFELRIRSTTPVSLLASLNWWLRPGITYCEGNDAPRRLEARERHALKGGRPLVLADEISGARITIEGLPSACHSVPVFHEPSIPSALPTQCAALHLGLLFPVDIALTLSCSPAAHPEKPAPPLPFVIRH